MYRFLICCGKTKWKYRWWTLVTCPEQTIHYNYIQFITDIQSQWYRVGMNTYRLILTKKEPIVPLYFSVILSSNDWTFSQQKAIINEIFQQLKWAKLILFVTKLLYNQKQCGLHFSEQTASKKRMGNVWPFQIGSVRMIFEYYRRHSNTNFVINMTSHDLYRSICLSVRMELVGKMYFLETDKHRKREISNYLSMDNSWPHFWKDIEWVFQVFLILPYSGLIFGYIPQ